MLLTRQEMTFDFGGARLDPRADAEVLGWMFNQFLYGEVTGIQVGQWIYDAPDLQSARFLSKQAIEEFQHVGNFLRIMKSLDLKAERPNGFVRFLATGMMGDSWPEHVAMEMALGEGFVAMAMYALIDTLDHEPTVEIMQRAVRQEEGHVEFGEEQTMKLIADNPRLRRRLLGLALVWMWGVGRIAAYIEKRLPSDHPVLGQVRPFLRHALECTETRILRMGLSDLRPSEMSAAKRTLVVSEAYGTKLLAAPFSVLPRRKRRLTDTYLDDPDVRALSEP